MSDMSQTGMKRILEKSMFNTNKCNKFSFGRSKRFQILSRLSSSTSDYYNLPSTRSKRTYRFSPLSYRQSLSSQKYTTPSPNHYQIKQIKKQGRSFGLSREKLKNNSYINSELDFYPSSTKYHPIYDQSATYIKSPRCIISKKQPKDSHIYLNQQQRKSPDPTHYKIDNFDKLAKHKKKKNVIFNKKQRFLKKNLSNIGPTSYHNQFSKKYQQKFIIFNKKYKKTSFIHDSIQSSISPGPKYYLP